MFFTQSCKHLITYVVSSIAAFHAWDFIILSSTLLDLALAFSCTLTFCWCCSIRKKCLNTNFFWSVFFCIQSKYRKIQTRKNSAFGHFSPSGFWQSLVVGLVVYFSIDWVTLSVQRFLDQLIRFSAEIDPKRVLQSKSFSFPIIETFCVFRYMPNLY